jgi:hypothetical protein
MLFNPFILTAGQNDSFNFHKFVHLKRLNFGLIHTLGKCSRTFPFCYDRESSFIGKNFLFGVKNNFLSFDTGRHGT